MLAIGEQDSLLARFLFEAGIRGKNKEVFIGHGCTTRLLGLSG